MKMKRGILWAALVLDVAAGECRLLLVPEYAVTERWSVGAGVVVAF